MDKRYLIALLFVFSILIMPTSALAEDTAVSFQMGTNSYNGVQDTTIVGYEADIVHGNQNSIVVGFNRSQPSLIKYDLSSISHNSVVKSAKLKLYITGIENEYVTGKKRLYEAYPMISDWNSNEATWNHRKANVNWLSNEGRNPGLDTDYDSKIVSKSDAYGVGTWVEFDIKDMAQAWVRTPEKNYGAVILDNSGYNDPVGSGNYRNFASSEYTDTTKRPILEITYDNTTPLANAGADLINMSWDKGAVTLDADGSVNLDGTTNNLSYSWKAIRAPFGSPMKNTVVATDRSTSFTPDRAGEWEIELTVTNELGKESKGTRKMRILSINSRITGKPRIFLDDNMLASLRNKANTNEATYVRFKNYLDNNLNRTREALTYSPDISNQFALMYQILKESNPTEAAKYANKAISLLQELFASDNEGSYTSYMRSALTASEISITYDWLYSYSGFNPEIKNQFIEHIKPRMKWGLDNTNYKLAFQNENLRAMRGLGMAGIAFYGELEDANKWIDCARNERFESLFLVGLATVGKGGGWGEGEQYSNSLELPLEFMLGWKSATGEDLFYSSDYYYELVDHYIHANSNDWISDYGSLSWVYRQLTRRGEMDTRYATFHDRTRYAMELVANGLGNRTETKIVSGLQKCWDWLVQPAPGITIDKMNNDAYAIRDFIWNKEGKGRLEVKDFGELAHYEEGIGMTYSRSSWNPDATWVTFQAGDHYNSHQQKDSGHFTIYKGGYLAIDSGYYDWFRSPHTANYANQSIAHNTIAVKDDSELFGFGYNQVAADTFPIVNTEGQRAWDESPFKGEVPSVDDFEKYKNVYDNGDIIHFENTDKWTYTMGDIKNAYSDKIQKFDREFLFIRPGWVVVYDRVKVREPSLIPRWLLHVTNEPTVDGNLTIATNGNHLTDQVPLSGLPDGKLFNRTLLPENAAIEKIGGPGKEYWVGGKNFPPDGNDRINEGSFRIEVSDPNRNVDNTFLNVMLSADVNTAVMPQTELIRCTSYEGTYIKDTKEPWVVLFGKNRSANGDTIEYEFKPITQETKHLVMNLNSGDKFKIEQTTNGDKIGVKLTKDANGSLTVSSEGILNFTTTGTIQQKQPMVINIQNKTENKTLSVNEDILTVSGTVTNASAAKVSATIAGVTKTCEVNSGTFSLQWKVSDDLLVNGSYSNIIVTAADADGTSVTDTYTGTITVAVNRNGQSFKFDAGVDPNVTGWAQASYTVQESNNELRVKIKRAMNDNSTPVDTTGCIAINYRLGEFTEYDVQQKGIKMAKSGEDFTPVSGTLLFKGGETEKEIVIPIINDNVVEGDESFLLYLFSPKGGARMDNVRPAQITIKDITNSSINPTTASFDKYTNSANYKDVEVTLNLNGNTLTSIKNGSSTLIANTDYTIGSTIKIKKEYLRTQTTGTTNLTFKFSAGGDSGLQIAIGDTTPAPYIPPYIPPTPQPTTETREVPVVVDNGGKDTNVAQVTVTRTTDSDGTKTDTVKFDEDKAKQTVTKALETKTNTATISVTDIPGNNADKVEVQVPQNSMTQLGSNNIGLDVKTEKAALELPKETVSGLKDKDAKIEISEVKDSSKVEETKGLILKLASGSEVIAAPLKIETNFTGRTKITLPIDTSKLPTSKEKLDNFLSSLAVMVQHSDGENKVDKGTIVYDEKGNPIGISIWVDKFSDFTIIKLPDNYFNYKVALSQTVTDTFTAQTVGYSPVAAQSVTVSKTGTGDITNLKVALSGSSADSFTLGALERETLNSSTTSAAFTIKPKDGLVAGTYTASVIVTADNGVSQSFDVSFTVFDYGVELSQKDIYIFAAQTLGYSPIAAQNVTVSKTGTGDITNLKVALSGSSADSFTLGALERETLNSSTTSAAFTIKPKDGLAAGTYTASVTVTADNGVSQSFDVSFTVNPVPVPEYETREIPYKVMADKEWNIKFTKEADKSTITKENVYVLDSAGKKVDVKVSYDSDNVLRVAPVSFYKGGETYSLYMNKNVTSKDKISLVKALKYNFTVADISLEGRKVNEFKDVPKDKEWKIAFTDSIDKNSFKAEDINLVDENGKTVEAAVSTLQDKYICVKAKSLYESGKTYYLIVNGVTSDEGNKMKKAVWIKFTAK